VAKVSKTSQASRKRRTYIHPLKRLFDYGQQYNKQIRQAIACSVLNKLFDLAPPALIGTAIDVVVKQKDSIIAQLGVKHIFGQFLILSSLTVVIWILESVFEYAYKRLWRNLSQNIQHNLRLDAYSHLQQLELAYFEERSTSFLISILSDDINQLECFLDGEVNDIIQVTAIVVIIEAAFFIIAPNIAWMAMLPMPFILLSSLTFQKRLTFRYADERN
jgi:ATP-binding cassette subfamily B protein